MTVDQKYRCDLIINTDGDDRVFHRNFGGLYSTLITSTSTVITQYYFDATIPKVYKRDVNISNDTTTETDLEIVSWNIIYSDDSISGGNTYPAGQVSYDNAESGLDADNAQDAIDEVLDDSIQNCARWAYQTKTSVTPDGVKTWKILINELFNDINVGLLHDTIVRIGTARYTLNTRSQGTWEFIFFDMGSTSFVSQAITYNASGSHSNTTLTKATFTANGITFTDMSNDVPTKDSTELAILVRTRYI